MYRPPSSTSAALACSDSRSGASGVLVSKSGTAISRGNPRAGIMRGGVVMFTSQSLRAVVKPGALAVREQRLDDVVHQLDVRGTLDGSTLGELARRIDAALAAGVRWLIVDIADTVVVADEALDALVKAGRELRSRKGELIVAGGPRGAAKRAPPHQGAPRAPPAGHHHP